MRGQAKEPISSHSHHSSEILRSLGHYRVFFAAIVAFNSICFRVILGVTSGSILEAVAIVSTIEWISNTILEIPGGLIADRFGRIRAALFGFFLFALGLFFSFFAMMESEHKTLALSLLVLDGLCFGLGKPLVSGTVEAFYQDALRRQPENDENNLIRDRSFTLSNRFAPYVALVAVPLAFGSIYVLQKTIGAPYLLVLGGILYFHLINRLYKDGKKYGEVFPEDSRQVLWDFYSSILIFLRNRTVQYGTFLVTLFHIINAVVAGYLVVSLGREFHSHGPRVFWMTMFSFMFGLYGIGWIARALVLPRLIILKHEQACLAIALTALLAWSLVLIYFGSELHSYSHVFVGLLLFFGASTQLALGAIQGISTNTILSQFDKRMYATCLSISNMPGYLCFGLISAYFASFSNGAPSLHLAFQITAFVTAIGLLGVGAQIWKTKSR